MVRLLSIAWLVAAVSAGILIIMNLLFASKGFYFTGDTIFYTNYSFSSNPGDIVPVFIKHSELWPPLTSIVFNLFHIFPVSIMAQHKIYVLLVSLATIAVTFLIAKKFTLNKGEVIIITSLSLFSSLQALLLRSAIAEPLFVFLWLASVYWLFKLLQSKKPFLLFLLILSLGLIPLARYAGVGTLLGFYILGVLYFLRHKSEKYAFYILFSIILLSSIPLGLYLLKNLATSGVIARSGDMRATILDPFFSFMSVNGAFQKDVIIPFLLALIVGFKLNWDKNKLLILGISAATFFGYQIMLTLSNMRYNVIENFPSRFISPTYPIFLLGTVAGGAYLAHAFSIFKRIFLIAPFVLTFFFGYQIYLTGNKMIYEVKSQYNYIEEPKYSGTIKKLCNLYPDKQRYVYTPSNYKWVALSLDYYCLPATIVPTDRDYFELEKGKILYSSYSFDYPTLKDVTPDESPKSKPLYKTGDTNGSQVIKIYLVEDKTKLKTGK